MSGIACVYLRGIFNLRVFFVRFSFERTLPHCIPNCVKSLHSKGCPLITLSLTIHMLEIANTKYFHSCCLKFTPFYDFSTTKKQ